MSRSRSPLAASAFQSALEVEKADFLLYRGLSANHTSAESLVCALNAGSRKKGPGLKRVLGEPTPGRIVLLLILLKPLRDGRVGRLVNLVLAKQEQDGGKIPAGLYIAAKTF